MSEIEDLKKILDEDWSALTYDGETVDGFETVSCEVTGRRRWEENMTTITRGPSGQLYLWEWVRGLTELQDDSGPMEVDSPVIPVVAKVEFVKHTIYVPLEGSDCEN
ncbi:Uncharacterised protein [Chlamydia trachomatis]|nr:Uncharacterised protein [Chlamydia trachomatis]